MADFGQSVLRQLRDIYSNPRLHLERTLDTLRNKALGLEPVASSEGAGMRKLSRDQEVKAYVDSVLNNVGGGGMGALGVIKAKGGNWLTGSVEDALRGLKKRTDPELEGYARRGQNLMPHEAADVLPKIALNDWIEGPLTKYVKRDMATEGDPVRRLAEQGITHVAPEQLYYGAREIHPSGDVLQKLGQSPTARAWENASDYAVASSPAETYQNFGSSNLGLDWVNKLDPKTPFYRPYGQLPSDLGFSHLTDELANALNPESGLPRNLLLNPADFQQMGMERAVRHVHNINEWRAAQKAAADLQRANNAATTVFKEYAENNPKGYRWVELGAPDRWPEGIDPAKKEEFGDLGRYSRNVLSDALKYEGDTMGHCVGGYCDDVLEGRSRIFSLRDAKGQPHVTIETSPEKDYDRLIKAGYTPEDLYVLSKNKGFEPTLPEGVSWNERSGTFTGPTGEVDFSTIVPNFREQLKSRFPDLYGKGYQAPSAKIVQIKGKANLAPKEEYLPFVQDFVRSGKWSDVGDLRNAGMVEFSSRRQTIPQGLTGRTPMGYSFESLGIPEGYYTESELLDHLKNWQNSLPENERGFAEGGLVSNYQRPLPFHTQNGIISNIDM